MSELLGALDGLRAAFAEAGDADRARAMSAYMKDKFTFFGVPAPDRRLLQAPLMAAAKAAPAADVLAFAAACWAEPERELQYAAPDVLTRRAKALGPDALPALAALIETKSWWDTVDGLSAHVVGDVVRRHPESVVVMDAWVGGDLWLARAAVLHQLRWGAATDAGRLFRYAEQHAGHEDFFMRKAIGWALRTYARVDPDAVRGFVATRALSGLTRREALKHLGLATRELSGLTR